MEKISYAMLEGSGEKAIKIVHGKILKALREREMKKMEMSKKRPFHQCH